MRVITRVVKGWSQPAFWNTDRPLITNSWGPVEKIDVDFERYVESVYKSSGIVFACIAARQMVFSQARFLWQRFEGGRPTDLFGNQDLAILETPWPNGSTGDLLNMAEQDVSLAGNFYATIIDDRDGPRFRRLRPDWVTIVTGSRMWPAERANQAPDARILAYIYEPPASAVRSDYENVDMGEPGVYEPKDTVHYVETPDPLTNWRGMSWLTPVIREIQGDLAATEHKLKFYKNGAMPGFAIRYDKDVSPERFKEFVDLYKKSQQGSPNAYKSLHIGGGSDVTPLTFDMSQLDFKGVQGQGETRIAAAAGAHPVIVGLAEGLQGSSLNAGNFGAARRLFVDGRIRSLWSKVAPALQSVLTVPAGARLWYDDRDIPFLREDAKDEATIRRVNSISIRALVDTGFDPDAVIQAVTSGDLRKLTGKHSGLYSVQLQPANSRSAQNGGQQ